MKGILLPTIIENIASRKDNTIKIILGTNEMSPADAGALFSLHGKLCSVYISPSEINQKEIDQVNQLDPELPGKTPSQRLRGVLFKLYDQDSEGFKEFDSFYKSKMEKIIDQLKQRIR